MARKKVLLLITKANFGGAQRYVFDLATNLPSEHYEVTVALGGDGPLQQKLAAAQVRVIHIPGLTRDISLRQEVTATRAIADIIRTEAPDILHVNSSKAGALGTAVGRLLRVPTIIFTAHGWSFNEDRPRLLRLVLKTIHWLTVLMSHRTITVSAAVQQQMNWWGVQQKMQTIHLGRKSIALYEPEQARTALSALHPQLTPYLADPWIVSIGELHPVKRHTDAITAMATLVPDYPRLRYLIIGAGEYQVILSNQIRDLHLTEHVHLLGHVDEAARYLRAATLFLFPSRSEALGYAALEAAQAGLPIIASNVGGLPEIITDGVSGTLVPPESPSAIVTAVSRYLNDPTLAHTHAQAAERHSVTFSVAAMVAATTTVYDR